MPRVHSSRHSQTISAEVSVIARYLASVLERETTACFLLRQEIREDPKKMQHPVVERRSVGSPTQSASV